MKQTLKIPGGIRFAIFTACMALTSSAYAQNFSYFYGVNVQGSGYTDVYGLPSDFDMEQYNENTGVLSSGASASTVSPDTAAFGTQGFSTVVDLGTFGNEHATDGYVEVVTSITLYLWVTGLSPNGSTTTFQIYDGLSGRSGGLIGDVVTLTEPTDEGSYVAIEIPTSLWDGDFSLGKDGQISTIVWNTVTEDGIEITQLPGFSVTTTLVAVPEPSTTTLLGGLVVALSFVRRRK
ncbi:PEP-CTERM sorting domain-containing protein [Luteolibacter pohnpeiensis]|uniref:PEP-CTERM sorting domain-containing protein n=1 Tax=Luteolibacter pohnpeiensis TaxID=454153 RepID=A0A934S7F5_9BACT|nr:PEP-CTERM sorting domain-containing protein [Luteolibacter pohnpeiensis]MBK1884470.1 PEP-CTERM sorting domain-containing protein [Luteolibacter pohnpeiensis]